MSTSTPEGLNIIITGGARGIGRVLARHFLARSSRNRVAILDADHSELSYCVDIHFRNVDKRHIKGIACDLRSAKNVRAAVNEAGEWFGGRLDVLVNNAGIARSYFTSGKTMEDPNTLDEWNDYIAVNLTGAFVASQACVPLLKKQASGRQGQDSLRGGCIVNISSFRAHQSDPNCEAYAASKAGLLGLTHAMAMSGPEWGIRSNAVLPGWISVVHECREGDEKGEKWAERRGPEDHEKHPAGRIGKGEDIAEAVEYLVGAKFVTGQELVVDGGMQKKKFPGV